MASANKRFRYTFTLSDGHQITGVLKAPDQSRAWRAVVGLRSQLLTNTRVQEEASLSFDEAGRVTRADVEGLLGRDA